MDGRIHFGKSSISGGGVGRNICEALSKLGCPAVFLSVLENDVAGNILKNFIPRESRDKVKFVEGHDTGSCIVLLDSKGECLFLAGDMNIHEQITPEMVYENKELIKNAPLLVFDANLSVPTIAAILELADRYNIPAFFEPTDVEISSKPFRTKHCKAIKFISPNLNELRYIKSYLKIPMKDRYEDIFNEIIDIIYGLTNYVDNIIVTLGADGIIIGRKGKASEPLLVHEAKTELSVRHYPTEEIKEIVNVSGAGDCLMSGFLVAMLAGLNEEECVSVAFAAAKTSLFSEGPVASQLFGKNHPSWKTKAVYKTLI